MADYAKILKANPYHDAKGEFTSKDKAKGAGGGGGDAGSAERAKSLSEAMNAAGFKTDHGLDKYYGEEGISSVRWDRDKKQQIAPQREAAKKVIEQAGWKYHGKSDGADEIFVNGAHKAKMSNSSKEFAIYMYPTGDNTRTNTGRNAGF